MSIVELIKIWCEEKEYPIIIDEEFYAVLIYIDNRLALTVDVDRLGPSGEHLRHLSEWRFVIDSLKKWRRLEFEPSDPEFFDKLEELMARSSRPSSRSR